MKIYIATSWKNEECALVMAQLLRQDGHEVDCFCDTSTGRYCFRWADHFNKIEDANVFSFLALPEAKRAFEEDKKWIDWCDAVVMIYPCGNSAHLEGGYAKGLGKMFFIIGNFPPGYFENMYGFADEIYDDDKGLNQLRERLYVESAMLTDKGGQ
ncbi:MAG: hypothetical protein JRD89_08125 [Deltaproteobacteria bacterium]|nr:hypothetical protein [Deltaproteobacteria bacterium]